MALAAPSPLVNDDPNLPGGAAGIRCRRPSGWLCGGNSGQLVRVTKPAAPSSVAAGFAVSQR